MTTVPALGQLRDEGQGRAALEPRWSGEDADGLEREARLLLESAFAERGVRVVVWRAEVGDWASRRLAWRLGFSFDGTVRRTLARGDDLRDAWVCTLLADEPRTPRSLWLDVPLLTGNGLRLRPWREADVPRIVEACRDGETQRWLGRMPSPYTEADARAWLEHQQENLARGQALNWAVVDVADEDRALASMSAFGLVPQVECEIGYWAHPDARGSGVVTRAMAVVVRHAFADLGVRRVTAGAAVDNLASRRVIEANGLRQWGIERAGTVVLGGRADIAWYDVLVEEWRATRR
jgi:RimJ/RimL family protein N-acetyltransferase